MTRFSLLVVAIAGACGGSSGVFAQGAVAEREPPQDTLFFVANAAPVVAFGGPFQVIGFGGDVPGAPVPGKPYSADSISESTQVLADGNRITARNEARFMRDSKGRTRREQTLRGFGPASAAREPVTMITINDPVAEVSYFLDTAARTAQPSRPLKLATGVAGTFTAAVPPPPPGAGGVPRPAAVFTTSLGPAPPPGMVGFEIQSSSGPAGVPLAPLGPSPTSFAMTTEDLGEQVLEGVLARGTRRTQTIPAGTFGNERPIQILVEQWFAPDLEAVVSSRNYDPRMGETTYRLVHVARGEQAPDLFAVPQGYTLLPEARPEFGTFRGGPGVRVERD
ncbi:MAG: hypothetical protein ABI640_03635 [Gammaproteobacteria bacterium]